MARRSAPSFSRRPSRSSRRSPSAMPTLIAGFLWVVVAALVYRLAGWQLYWAWLAGGTVATLLLFAFDKAQSKGVGRRVPEVVLLALVLLGGVIGGWIGMLIVRHKTRHGSFWLVQWLATALHVAIAWWLAGTIR